MGSPYAQNRSQIGSAYAQPRPQVAPSAAAAPARKGGGGLLGTLGRIPGDFASGALHFAAGLPTAAYDIAKYPAVAAYDIAKYGPNSRQGQSNTDAAYRNLVQSQVQSAKQTVQHPLREPFNTFLWGLTAADLGAAGLGKAGVVSTERAALPVRSPRKVVTGEGPQVTKLSETKPLVRGRQVLTNKALAKIRYTAPAVGEGARYGKEIRRASVRQGLKEMPAYRTYVHATKKLSDQEWAALNLIPRDVHPADLAAYWQGTRNADIVANPKVAALVQNPTPRLQAAVAAARELSQQGAKVYKDLGIPADKNPALFRERVAAKLGRDVKPLHGDPFYLPDVIRPTRSSDPFQAFGGGKGQPRIPGSAKQNKGVLQELGKLNLEGDVLGPNFLSRVKLKTHAAVHQGLLQGAMKLTPSELDAVLAEHGGVPRGWDYVTAPTVSRTVEKTVSAEPNPAQMTIPGAGTATKTVKARVRFQTPTRQVGGTPQRIGPLRRAESVAAKTAQPADLGQLLADPKALDRRLGQPLGTPDKTQAYFDGTHYYLAPKATIRAAAGEFHQSAAAVRYLVEKPLSAWRSIILGLRVGFLTNNVVGNAILYAVRTAGIGGLRSFLNAVREAKGPDAVKALLEDPPTAARLGSRVTKQLMDEFFPEQVQGTFGRTQSPILESPVPSRARKLGQRAKLGIIPATQAVAETLPRRALVETMIRRSPEFKQVYRKMAKETRTFEGAARKVLSGEGGAEYQRLISDQVNKALGDYLNTGAFGRAARNFLPFFSWYKAIATITFHLAVDTPGRALAIAQLSKIGQEDANKLLGALPSYLQGFIPFGKPNARGDVTGLSTQGLNPYSTLSQLGRGVTGDVGNLGLSPFIQIPLDTYAQSQRYGGNPPGLLPLLASAGKTFATGLPLAQLVAPPPPSKLYPERNRLTQFYGFLGAPVKKPNLREAHARAAAGK